jgi:hypothetical protein
MHGVWVTVWSSLCKDSYNCSSVGSPGVASVKGSCFKWCGMSYFWVSKDHAVSSSPLSSSTLRHLQGLPVLKVSVTSDTFHLFVCLEKILRRYKRSWFRELECYFRKYVIWTKRVISFSCIGKETRQKGHCYSPRRDVGMSQTWVGLLVAQTV